MVAEYEVRDVACDHGVYEDGELKLILNSRRIALQIVELLKEDERIHRELNPIKNFKAYFDMYAGKCNNGLYPTMTVQQIMLALKNETTSSRTMGNSVR